MPYLFLRRGNHPSLVTMAEDPHGYLAVYITIFQDRVAGNGKTIRGRPYWPADLGSSLACGRRVIDQKALPDYPEQADDRSGRTLTR
jgi:hypothetical protein